MPMEMIQCFRKTFAIFIDDVFDVWIACVILEYLTVIKTTYSFPCAVFCSDPSFSMSKKSRGSAAGKSWKCLLCLIAPLAHFATVSYSSFAICGREKLRQSVSFILCWSRCLTMGGWCARCKIRFARWGECYDFSGVFDGWFTYKEAAVVRVKLRIRVANLYWRFFAIWVARLFDDELVLSWRRITRRCDCCRKPDDVLPWGANDMIVCLVVVWCIHCKDRKIIFEWWFVSAQCA